jgi:hypothetical protein
MNSKNEEKDLINKIENFKTFYSYKNALIYANKLVTISQGKHLYIKKNRKE